MAWRITKSRDLDPWPSPDGNIQDIQYMQKSFVVDVSLKREEVENGTLPHGGKLNVKTCSFRPAKNIPSMCLIYK
ncbi:hypothetical protein scyTo_0016257 [Scyliorhinus torazame]|uniref:Uncharacterized protein n=1 Tax=Scyliorhinus torazame TaxID=75743 RepID=A0A401Q5B7_SCYTO|nr:hypothetical protein [Scyliorhinus torazame]